MSRLACRESSTIVAPPSRISSGPRFWMEDCRPVSARDLLQTSSRSAGSAGSGEEGRIRLFKIAAEPSHIHSPRTSALSMRSWSTGTGSTPVPPLWKPGGTPRTLASSDAGSRSGCERGSECSSTTFLDQEASHRTYDSHRSLNTSRSLGLGSSLTSEKERIIQAFKSETKKGTALLDSDVTLSQFRHRLDSLLEQGDAEQGSLRHEQSSKKASLAHRPGSFPPRRAPRSTSPSRHSQLLSPGPSAQMTQGTRNISVQTASSLVFDFEVQHGQNVNVEKRLLTHEERHALQVPDMFLPPGWLLVMVQIFKSQRPSTCTI
jgi:hypothetical protein